MRKISSWTTRNTPVIGKVYLVLIPTLLLHHLTSHKQMADSSIVTAQDQRCLLENLPYLAKFLEPGSSWVYHRTENASNEAIKHTIKSTLFTNTPDFVFTFHVPAASWTAYFTSHCLFTSNRIPILVSNHIRTPINLCAARTKNSSPGTNHFFTKISSWHN